MAVAPSSMASDEDGWAAATESTTILVSGDEVLIWGMALSPSRTGIMRSRKMASGWCSDTRRTASSPLAASATTSKRPSHSKAIRSMSRTSSESSASTTRMGMPSACQRPADPRPSGRAGRSAEEGGDAGAAEERAHAEGDQSEGRHTAAWAAAAGVGGWGGDHLLGGVVGVLAHDHEYAPHLGRVDVAPVAVAAGLVGRRQLG